METKRTPNFKNITQYKRYINSLKGQQRKEEEVMRKQLLSLERKERYDSREDERQNRRDFIIQQNNKVKDEFNKQLIEKYGEGSVEKREIIKQLYSCQTNLPKRVNGEKVGLTTYKQYEEKMMKYSLENLKKGIPYMEQYKKMGKIVNDEIIVDKDGSYYQLFHTKDGKRYSVKSINGSEFECEVKLVG